MKTSPIYIFEDDTSIGVFDVPESGLIMLRKGGDNLPALFTKISNTGITNVSSIGDFLVSGNYDPFKIENLSELEKIQEGVNTGWRLLGRDPANFGDVGADAVDFSKSTGSSGVAGSTGEAAFATGIDTEAGAKGSFISGIGTTVNVEGAAAFGKYNIGGATGHLFEVGYGTGPGTRVNLFEIDENCGRINAPEMSIADIDDPLATDRVLITREYLLNAALVRVLDDLDDVDTTTVAPVNNDMLVFDSVSGLWINGGIDFGLYP